MKHIPVAVAVAVILTVSISLGAATLTLTQASSNSGFKLTTFATISPGNTGNNGPFGVVVLSNGNVMVSNYATDARYVFTDTDGQTTGTALKTIVPSGSQAGAFARAGGQAYGPVNVKFVQFNADGTVNHALTGFTQTPWFGMWGNPVNGHILSTTGQGQIIDIDPTAGGGTGSARVVTTPGLSSNYDGVCVSPDGVIVYVIQNSHVIGYNIASGAQVFDSGLLPSGPDSVAVITSSNSLNGKLVVNFNGPTVNAGYVGLLDPATKVVTTIASGGTRGDYIAPDPTNGSAFLSYSDLVYRLSCGANCSIGVPPAAGTPVISANGVVNGASFLPGIVPNSWATIQGSNLAPGIDTWDKFIVNGILPSTLDGVTVTVGGKSAYLNYINPDQINLVVPDVGPGPMQVTVATPLGTSAAFSVNSSVYGPAFFPWPGNQAVATRQDFTWAVKNDTFAGVTTVPAKPGDVIILWGTGFGPTTPAAPTGVQVPADTTYSTSTLPTVRINNLSATVYGAALAPGFAGLYQVAIQVPPTLADGDWPVLATIGGVTSPTGIVLTVKQ